MATEPRYDLLSEALIPVRFRDGTTRELSLPGLLSALQAEGVESFPTLRPHQSHPWHAFLVQLAAMAIHRTGGDTEPASTEIWAERLLSLGDGQREAWCLVVPDLSKPAFFQPPVPEGNLSKFGKWPGGTPFPDEIDMLVTAKNHDVKIRRIRQPTISHWIFALTTVQTTDGYAGKNTYGIVRMNGGYSNRPSIGYTPGHFPSERFIRDLRVLMKSRNELVGDFAYPESRGYSLLWLLPWDGEGSLQITECDPYFLEVCRRIRLLQQSSEILAVGASTSSPRIDDKNINGRTGDPWNAITLGEPATSLTLKKDGSSYRRIQELIAGDSYAPGVALRTYESDPSTIWFSIATLVRGRGTTEGHFERMIPVSGRVRSLLLTREGRDHVGKLAKARVKEASEIQHKALKPAILSLIQGAPEKLNKKDDRAIKFLNMVDDNVDQVFFSHLWDAIQEERDPDEALDSWAATVFDIAEEILDEAIQSLPIPESRKFRAISKARRIFFGRKKARLGDRKEPSDAALA